MTLKNSVGSGARLVPRSKSAQRKIMRVPLKEFQGLTESRGDLRQFNEGPLSKGTWN